MLEARDRSAATGVLIDESFSLGPYQVDNVDRDWTKTESTTVALVATVHQEVGGYSYELRDKGQRTAGRCRTLAQESALALGGSYSLSTDGASLRCSCGESASASIQTEDGALTGTLALGERKYTLRPIHGLENGSEQSVPAGYRADADDPFAAVEVQHPGRVWLSPTVNKEDRLTVSCLLAGFMLYQALRDLASSSVVPAAGHEQLQHVPEHQRDRREQLERGRDVAVFRIVVEHVRRVVQDRGAGEADHRHGEEGAELEAEDGARDDRDQGQDAAPAQEASRGTRSPCAS